MGFGLQDANIFSIFDTSQILEKKNIPDYFSLKTGVKK